MPRMRVALSGLWAPVSVFSIFCITSFDDPTGVRKTKKFPFKPVNSKIVKNVIAKHAKKGK